MSYQMGDNEESLFGTPSEKTQMGVPGELEKTFTNTNIPRFQQGTNEHLWGAPGEKPVAPGKSVRHARPHDAPTEEEGRTRQYGEFTEPSTRQMG